MLYCDQKKQLDGASLATTNCSLYVYVYCEEVTYALGRCCIVAGCFHTVAECYWHGAGFLAWCLLADDFLEDWD